MTFYKKGEKRQFSNEKQGKTQKNEQKKWKTLRHGKKMKIIFRKYRRKSLKIEYKYHFFLYFNNIRT